MARKKEPEKHPSHERWLVSFADFMTLLFALFVVLFANSVRDSDKMKAISVAVSQAFGNMGLWKSGGSVPLTPIQPLQAPVVISLGPSPNNNPDSETNPLETSAGQTTQTAAVTPPAAKPPGGVGAEGSQEMKQVADDLMELLKKEMEEKKIAIKIEKRGIVISLGEAAFFRSGSADLEYNSLDIIDALAGKLVSLVKERNIVIRVEGHTDNVPLVATRGGRYRDNLELSTARANSVVRRLLEIHRFPPWNVFASGYGEYRPVAGNKTPEGRARNRRVDIVLLSNELAALEPTGSQ
jgi:chemotaxis protein MotB